MKHTEVNSLLHAEIIGLLDTTLYRAIKNNLKGSRHHKGPGPARRLDTTLTVQGAVHVGVVLERPITQILRFRTRPIPSHDLLLPVCCHNER